MRPLKTSKEKPRQPRRTTGIMLLEPRVMYDGAHHHADHHSLADHHHDIASGAAASGQGQASSAGASPPVSPAPQVTNAQADTGQKDHGWKSSEPMPQVVTWVKNPTEIVFIDAQVPDYQALVAGANPGVEVVLLNSNSDGLQQIADFLGRHPDPNLTTIAIVAHGEQGALTLGSTNITDAGLVGEASALATIGQALQPGGNIQLYGCDVAEGSAGLQFISDLSAYTGKANVSASTQDIGTLTGTGGTFENWTLNASTGTLDAAVPFTAAALAGYEGLLSNQTFQVSTNEGASPQVATLGNGDIAIVFTSPDGDSFVDVYNQNGTKIGEVDLGGNLSFLVSYGIVDGSTNGSTSTFWVLEGLPDSNFNYQIYAQQLTDSGSSVIVGTQKALVVNSDDNSIPSAVQLSNGDYVLAWAANTVDPQTFNFLTGATDIEVFNSSFAPLTSSVAISSGANSSTTVEDIFASANGMNVNVTWTVVNPNPTIFGASFAVNSTTGAITGQTSPVQLTTGSVQPGEQTTFANGDILLLYDTAEGSSFVAGEGSLYGEIFGPGFTSPSTPFLIDAATEASNGGTWTPDNPDVFVFSTGDYIVTYSQNTSLTQSEIYAVIYNSNNTPLTNIFEVTTPVNNTDNVRPEVTATNGEGGFALVWEKDNGSNTYIDAAIYSDVGPISNGDASQVPDAFENTSPAGTQVSSLISVGDGDQFYSLSGHALAGVAIIGDAATAAQGVWQYSTDGGANWINISTSVSETNATILAASDLIRFDPAANFSGTPGALTTMVWDGQDGFTANTTSQNISTSIFDTSNTNQTTSSFTNAFASETVAFNTDIIGLNQNQTATVAEGASLIEGAPGVLGGATNLDGHQLTVSAVDGSAAEVGTSIIGTYGVLMLNANGAYSYVANNTSAINAAVTGSDPTDAFTFTVSDGRGATTSATLTFSIDRPPVVTTSGNTVNVNQTNTPVQIDSGVAVNDPNGSELASATVSIAGYTTSDGDSLAIPAGDLTSGKITGTNITASYSNGVLTLTGTDTVAHYQTALRDVTFSTTSSTDGNRTIDFTASDGLVASTTATDTVDVQFGPVIGSAGNTVDFYQSQTSATAVDGAITLADPGTNIASATVTISSGYLTGDTLSFNNGATTETINGATITATQSGNQLMLTTISGNASAADYQTALESVTYGFNGDPTNAGADRTRTITWTVTDANSQSNVAGSTTTLDVFATPVVSVGIGTVPTVTSTSGAVTADSGVTVNDNNGTTLAGATVVISAGAQTGDTLSDDGVTNGGLVPGAANIHATFSGTTLTLSGSDTVADYITALDEVEFDAASPNSGTRTLTWTVNDNAGGHANDSVPVTSTVNVAFGPVITTLVGQPANGGTVELEGTGQTTGDTIDLYADGGTTLVGTGTVIAGGTFEITTTADFADGTHTFTATETNASNQISSPSPAFAVAVSSVAPTGLAQAGTSSNGGTIEITGTGDVAGDTIKLYEGVTLVGTGTAGANGAFDITTTATFADGTHHLTATDTSVDGTQTSVPSSPVAALVTSNAPTGLAQAGSASNGGTIEITGTGDAVGDTIKLYEGTTLVGTGTAGANGAFDITTTATFADGTHHLTATDTSADGTETSAPSGPVAALVSSTAPTGLAQAGSASNGGTIEITGTGDAAGDTIKLYEGATLVGTGTAGANGAFDITTTATFADGTVSLTATDTSVDGTQTSAPSSPVAALVTSTAPTGLAQAGTASNGGTIEITGTGDAAGDTIKLYAGATLVGTGTAGANGAFDITTTATFADGTHHLTATDTSSDGTETSAPSGAVAALVTSTAPTGLAQQGTASNGGTIEITGTGDVAGDTITLYDGTTAVGSGIAGAGGAFDITTTATFADGTHHLTATDTSVDGTQTSAPSSPVAALVSSTAPTGLAQAGTASNGGTIEITGTGDVAGDTIKLYEGATLVGTGTAGANGAFDITTTATFADGTVSLTATDTSVDGTETSVPSSPVAALVTSTAPTGLAQAGTASNGGTIEITGTGDAAGDTIKLYEGATLVGTGSAGVNGAFDITTTAHFADGTVSLTATDTSVDGTQTSAPSSPVAALVTSTAPTGLAQAGSASNGGTIEITGTGDAAGDTIKLYEGTTLVGTGTAGANGAFDITTTATFADGTHHLTATDTSSDGTETSAPSSPVAALVTSSAPTGLAQAGSASNGGTIEITGTGDAAGDTIKLYEGTTLVGTGTAGANGAFDITTTAHFADGTVSLTATDTSVDGTQTSVPSGSVAALVTSTAPTGLAQQGTASNGGTIEITGTGDAAGDTITLYDGTTAVGSGIAGAGGAFDITTTATFADGTHHLTATDTSSDGTETSVPSSPVAAVVSSTAPTGLAQAGSASNGGTIEITGTGDAAGDTIKLYEGTALVGTGTAGANGAFDITTTATFADGTHHLTATDTSADGTETSVKSGPVTAIVDPNAPTGLAVSGVATSGQTVTLTGLGEQGDTIKLYEGTTLVGTGTAGANGAFDITTTATFANGVHTFTATETDSEGLTSAPSRALTVNIPLNLAPPPSNNPPSGLLEVSTSSGQFGSPPPQIIIDIQITDGPDVVGGLGAPAFSFGAGVFPVHAELDVTMTADGKIAVDLPLAALEAPLHGDIVMLTATLADGKPLPGWLHLDIADGKFAFAGQAPDEMVTASIPHDGGVGRDAARLGEPSGPVLPSINVQIVAHDSHGQTVMYNVILKLVLPPHAKDGAWNLQDRHHFGLIEPITPRDIGLSALNYSTDHSRQTFEYGRGSEPHAGRAGLSTQLDALGWRGMHMHRTALLESLQRLAAG